MQVVEPEGQKIVVLETALDSEIIGNLSGVCHIRALYADNEARSPGFEIGGGVNVNVEIVEGVSFKPGDVVNISGSAVKWNGGALNG